MSDLRHAHVTVHRQRLTVEPSIAIGCGLLGVGFPPFILGAVPAAAAIVASMLAIRAGSADFLFGIALGLGCVALLLNMYFLVLVAFL